MEAERAGGIGIVVMVHQVDEGVRGTLNGGAENGEGGRAWSVFARFSLLGGYDGLNLLSSAERFDPV